MTPGIHRVAIGALVLGLCASALAQAPGQGQAKAGAPRKITKAAKHKAAQPQKPPDPPVPAPPPQPVAPLRPEQMPPTAPQVTYQEGQLSILAENSTLSSILAAVRARTGAHVEMPPDTANDRVVAKLGPGNPRDVLSSLLQGSRFDYIVLGSAADPDAVSQVILTPHRGGATTAVAGAGQPAAAMAGGPAQHPGSPFVGAVTRPEVNAEDDEAETPQPAPEPVAITPQPQPQVQPQPFQVFQPAVLPQAQQFPQSSPMGSVPESPEQPQVGTPSQPQVKSPEQLLQELQRIQQQQQQQQQQQRQQPPRQP